MRKRANRNLHLGITTTHDDDAFFLKSSFVGNDYPLGKLKGGPPTEEQQKEQSLDRSLLT